MIDPPRKMDLKGLVGHLLGEFWYLTFLTICMWFLGSCHRNWANSMGNSLYFFGKTDRKPSILPGKIRGFPLQIVSHQSSEYHLAPLVTSAIGFCGSRRWRAAAIDPREIGVSHPSRSISASGHRIHDVIHDGYFLWWLMVATKGFHH